MERQLKRRSSEVEGLVGALRGSDLAVSSKSALDVRFAKVSTEIDLESLGEVSSAVQRVLHEEQDAVTAEMFRLKNTIEDRFKEFKRQWPAEAGGSIQIWPALTTTSPSSIGWSMTPCQSNEQRSARFSGSRAIRT